MVVKICTFTCTLHPLSSVEYLLTWGKCSPFLNFSKISTDYSSFTCSSLMQSIRASQIFITAKNPWMGYVGGWKLKYERNFNCLHSYIAIRVACL